MSVHQLSSQNFSLSGRGQKQFLNINLQGAVLCFFKMDSCPSCKGFEPIFLRLASEEPKINYAIINLSSSRDVVSLSRKSTTQITAVPFLLLFVNGGPHAKYNGKKSIQPLKSFINKALQSAPPPNITPTQGFMPRGGNMYDGSNGGYPQSSHMAPQRGHAGYSHYGGQNNQQGSKVNMPEIGNAPNMKGKIKGDVSSQYSYMEGEVEDDEDDKLLLPDQITPYNVPWEVNFKKIGTLD